MNTWPAAGMTPFRYEKNSNPFLDGQEGGITSNTYYQWLLENGYLVMAASVVVSEFMKTFEAFPPRQKAASFTIDQAMAIWRASQARPCADAGTARESRLWPRPSFSWC